MKRLHFCSIAVFFLVTGCATSNFNKVDPEEISLGVSDRASVIEAVGNPERKYVSKLYGYSEPIEQVTHSYIRAEKVNGDLYYFYREQSLQFANDVLVGYTFVSGFPDESTRFDIRKARHIKPGETTVDEVVELLGPPAGERIAPFSCKDSARDLIYKFYYDLRVQVNENYEFEYDFVTKKNLMLVVQFDDDEVVTRLAPKDICPG